MATDLQLADWWRLGRRVQGVDLVEIEFAERCQGSLVVAGLEYPGPVL